MKIFPILLIIFGIIIIIFPEIIAYFIGGLFIFIGVNILVFFKKKGGKGKEDYVKFGNYKIFR
ncbi:MAG: hypothetical protein QM490_05020 [Candidatus Gracilibacteria bacterium]